MESEALGLVNRWGRTAFGLDVLDAAEILGNTDILGSGCLQEAADAK